MLILLNQTYIFCADVKENADRQNQLANKCSACQQTSNNHDFKKHWELIEFLFNKEAYKRVLLRTSEVLLLLPKDKYKYPQVKIVFLNKYDISITDMIAFYNCCSRIMLCEDTAKKNQLIFEYYNFYKYKPALQEGIVIFFVQPLGFDEWKDFEEHYKKQNYKPLTSNEDLFIKNL